MGKRELKALEREQAERHAARCAVFAELWADPRYVRMSERLDWLNRGVSLGMPDAERRFKRYHRRIQAVQRAAMVKAGFPNG